MENVVGVMESVAVDRRKEMWSAWKLVLNDQLEKIYQEYSTEEQRMHACADFCVNINLESSWTILCKKLYRKREMIAARKAKTFIPQSGE